METPVRPYEAVVIVKDSASLEAQKELFRKNKGIIEAHDGALNTLETWGKKYLANEIKKERQGVFFHSTFTANADAVAELERTMKINDDVLRYMHTRLEDDTDLNKHMEEFKNSIVEAQKREKEREAKVAKRRAARK
jgi:small subunit ribosomal protein S6